MKQLPKIDTQYWAMILSATTLGETAGDLISRSLGLGYGLGSVALIALFIIALVFELRSKTQNAFLYWLVIILTSTAGTTMSDYVTRSLGLGYGWGTLLMLGTLAGIFLLWKSLAQISVEKSASNTKTETLYWAAILVSSTLGTAFGDYIADETPLGFGGSSLVLLGLLVLVAVLALFTKTPRDLCYWLAIFITHPVGATMGDFLTKDEGLNLGNVVSSIILLVVFGLVVVLGNKLKGKPALTA